MNLWLVILFSIIYIKPGYILWTFESNEQSVGTNRWERVPNRKSIPLREIYTVLIDSKGIVLQKLRKAGKGITGEYYRDCVPWKLNEYYKKSAANLRQAWNQTSSW